MADGGGERQARQDAYQPRLGPADLLSDDALKYADGVAALQAAAAADPELNGKAARGRVRGHD